VRQTKRVAEWATSLVRHDAREVKKAEVKKRERLQERLLRYQEAFNKFTRLRTKLRDKATACRIYFRRLAAHFARKIEEGMGADQEWDSDDDVAAVDGAYVSPSHAIADEVGAELDCCCGRTLREWAQEWMREGAFTLDRRGTASEEHLLDEEDTRHHFVACMRERSAKWGAGGLTIEHFRWDVIKVVIPALLDDDSLPGIHDLIHSRLNKNEEGEFCISTSTAYAWMDRCSARRRVHRDGYYTDLHERDDVKAYRVQYLYANRSSAGELRCGFT